MKESRAAKKPATAADGAESTDPSPLDLDLPDKGSIRLELPGFEGPLDLLLHLIQEHELDILDIPIAFVTEKYLEYIGLMQVLNIDVASEYLVMAATLAHIKSRMLLPTPPADLEEGDEEEIDPRAELIRRLLEYQKYKQAGEELAARSVLGRDIFVRAGPTNVDLTSAPLAPDSSFKLLDAFQRILARAKIVIDHQIEFERFSLSDRINHLVDLLKNRGRLAFEDLFEGQFNRADLVVTFLALLELTRLRVTRLFQGDSLEPIFVELTVTDDEDPSIAAPDQEIVEAPPANAAAPQRALDPVVADGQSPAEIASVDYQAPSPTEEQVTAERESK
jgi:segregation and condensation protein A